MNNNIKTVAIAGAGTMGASMAGMFSKFGYEVILTDVSTMAIDNAMQSIKKDSEALINRINCITETRLLKKADLLIEAIVENLDMKQKFWAEISQVVSDHAILASNTSGLSITEIAKSVKKPERFLGMHWINPPHIIPLIEIIKGESTGVETIETIKNICMAINKEPVVVKDAPGFVLNRIQLAVLRECLHIVESDIASIEDVDKVMKYALGIRYACLGPFEVVDHGGIDVFHNIAGYLFEDLSSEKDSFSLLKRHFENGQLGVKTQKGFYDYSNGMDEEAIMYRDRLYMKIVKCLFEG
ncbi:MAG TPA: 3-hydroxyacyl-CoA dehydrogenase family protein [Anaerovoracaceae bacterium]|nr:3-hydroxyacyl-CoA dehydrogenase family protein [Anaerovoracaceae bacterium]